MRGFRGDQAERLQINPDEIFISPDNYEIAYEIVSSMGKVDTVLNNKNVHEGAYTIVEWNYMSDANDWFMADSVMRKDVVKWFDRIPIEFAYAEDLDTIVAKWRGYMRYAPFQSDWRWVLGHQVT